MPNIPNTKCNLHTAAHIVLTYRNTNMLDTYEHVCAGEHLLSECDKNVAKMCHMRGIFNFQPKRAAN